MLTKHTFTAIKFATLLFCSQSAMAISYSFTGNFTNDNDVQLFNFSIASDSTTLSIHTLSLNGGTNAAGDIISSGGFNPYLAIFNQLDGAWVFDTSSKSAGEEAIIANYGTLVTGNYILALTQFDNVAFGSNLSDGFAADYGLASFDPIPFTTLGGGGSSHWAVDILTADTASVPTPEALILTLLGMMGYGVRASGKLNIKTGLSA